VDAGDLRSIRLFDGLSDDQLSELVAVGEERRFETGEELFRQAQPADHWWVLLEGSLGLFRHVGHEETLLTVMDSPGQWAGGLRAWDAHGVYLATGRGAVPGRLLRVPAARLRERAETWFPFGVHLILGLVNTARSIESSARQREALVALGRLAAGLAHEINNPASAATSAADAVEETSRALQAGLGRLVASSVSPAQFDALGTLLGQIDPRSASREPLAVADREDAVSDWLVRHGVEREWLLAPPLAAAGVDVAWCERVAALLDDASLAPGLEWVASSLSMAALLSELKESTRRISDLVAAVRAYSQLDRASLQRFDVTEGLESTLVMLAHKIGPGVTVVRDYAPDIPRLEAFPGELNQVWTHLIDNALEAMAGAGTLRVSTGVSDDSVVVEIGDTGPGMPEEVRAHAFEPFFTTKGVGEGAGLGLDVSRRIVADRHGGDIAIDQRPAETVLRVRLPLRPKARRD
jgi:signal transduction histidine kinase